MPRGHAPGGKEPNVPQSPPDTQRGSDLHKPIGWQAKGRDYGFRAPHVVHERVKAIFFRNGDLEREVSGDIARQAC